MLKQYFWLYNVVEIHKKIWGGLDWSKVAYWVVGGLDFTHVDGLVFTHWVWVGKSTSRNCLWLPGTNDLGGLKTSKTLFISFRKIWKKIIDVANDVYHKRAKYQFVLHENDKSVDLKMCIFKSLIFSFLCSPKYNVFEIYFLHVYGIHNWPHQWFFFRIFWNS